MGIFSIINTSGSGLTAQRTRLDVIADNHGGQFGERQGLIAALRS